MMNYCYFILKRDIERNIKRVRKGICYQGGGIVGYDDKEILFGSFSIEDTTLKMYELLERTK